MIVQNCRVCGKESKPQYPGYFNKRFPNGWRCTQCARSDPWERKKNSDAQRKSYEDNPESRKKTSEAAKKMWECPEICQKMSDSHKEWNKNNPEKFEEREQKRFESLRTPESRKRNSESLKKAKGTAEARQKQSEAMADYFKIPGSRERQSELQKKAREDPEVRKKMGELIKKAHENDPMIRKRMSESRRKYFGDPIQYERFLIKKYGQGFWYGNPRINFDMDLRKEIRKSLKYKEWAKAVLARDGYKDWFSGCGKSKQNPLVIHHMISFDYIMYKYDITSLQEAWDCKELWDTNNGVTMLRETHVAYHSMWGRNKLFSEESG